MYRKGGDIMDWKILLDLFFQKEFLRLATLGIILAILFALTHRNSQ